ncbi:MAG: ABC transporter substrate-binding protein [Hyphomicrobiales bacterium]|nr:ABC transporter substrate-binding protein [Hyphomicrobiales bacterium]
MAAEDFGGKVLGRPIEIVFADHQNKADLAGSIATKWFDDQGVEAILDVAASATYGAVIATDYDTLAAERPGRYDVVVNATSASLRGELPPVPRSVFGKASFVYELAYGKGLTPFLHLARDAGVERVCDGVGMLVEQAAEAFAWWRGVRPDTRSMIEQLTVPLLSPSAVGH